MERDPYWIGNIPARCDIPRYDFRGLNVVRAIAIKTALRATADSIKNDGRGYTNDMLAHAVLYVQSRE